MNVEIGTEVAQFPEKEYINAIVLVVHILYQRLCPHIQEAVRGRRGQRSASLVPLSEMFGTSTAVYVVARSRRLRRPLLLNHP